MSVAHLVEVVLVGQRQFFTQGGRLMRARKDFVVVLNIEDLESIFAPRHQGRLPIET